MPKFSSCPQGVVTHKRVIPNNGDVAWKTEFVFWLFWIGSCLWQAVSIQEVVHRGLTASLSAIHSITNQPWGLQKMTVSRRNYIIPLKKFILRGPQRSIIFVAYPSETVATLFPLSLEEFILGNSTHQKLT